MPTNYPGSIDSLTDPTSNEPMNAPSHSGQHTNANDAIEAIETFVGTTSSPNFAKLNNPHFTGVPTAPTNATATDSSTQLATDAFVQNAVAAYAAPGLRLIYVDELGADPTGINDSSAVIRTKQTALGTAAYQLVFGQGTYLMSSAFINFGPNQGVVGQGSALTGINWSSSNSLITATDASFSASARAGKFGGFTINGPYGSGTTSGISYGNLQSIIIDDVLFYGLPGGAILGSNPGGGYAEEAQMSRLSMSECGAELGAVMQFVGTSFDYSSIDAVVVVEANIDILSLVSGAQMQGLNLSLRGNCHGGTGTNTGAIVAIDRGNTSGTSNLRNAHFAVAMEANDSPGVVGHYLLWMGSTNSTSQFDAEGTFHLFAAGATCQGGVGFTSPGNPNFLPCAFSGLTNAQDGTDMASGDALAVMGGTDWTPALAGNLSPISSAGGSHTIYWQFADVAGISLGTGANTLVFNGANSFVRRVDLFLVQPSSGAAATVTFPATVQWVGGITPLLSTVASAVDHIRLTYIPSATTPWVAEKMNSGPALGTLTVTAGAVTVPVGYPVYNFTVSASTTITMATTGAYDSQRVLVRILDGGSAETLTFSNTENSSIVVPTASAGSTTIPRTVAFMFNGVTSKWTCEGWA